MLTPEHVVNFIGYYIGRRLLPINIANEETLAGSPRCSCIDGRCKGSDRFKISKG